MTEQKYRLYAGKTTTVPENAEFSLLPTHNHYILVFTDKPLKAPFKEIPEGTELTDEEKKWLLECKISANTRYLQEHKDEITEGFNLLLEAVEKELKAEQKKVGEKK